MSSALSVTGLPGGSLQPRTVGASGTCLAKGSWQGTNHRGANLEVIVRTQCCSSVSVNLEWVWGAGI